MSVKKRSSDVKVEVNKKLLIDESLISKKTPSYLKKFNKCYEAFFTLNEKEDLTNQEKEDRLENGVEAAINIALYFDFNLDLIKENKSEYIKFARDVLYEAGGNPNNNGEAMIYLIKALYGYTNIAYSHQNEHKEKNIIDGNEWVDYLEKNSKNRVLKAYALTLRAYQYIVNGDVIGMSMKDRLNKSEKDLIYATKWDEDNYFAYFALALVYFDSGNSKYNKEKAINNFNKVLSYEDEYVELDKYLTDEEKQRCMRLARKQLEVLNNQ